MQSIEEKWAQTLLRSLTLGPDADFGNQRPNHVPTDVNGRPLGFTNDDVRAVARCFTGWTVRDGRFLYRHDWHDAGGKWIMDLYIPPGQGHRRDGEILLDWLASHPATAYYICGKLWHFFLGEVTPQMVRKTAKVFLKYQNAPDQIRHVLRHILYSKQFITSWGAVEPTYFGQVVSLIRALGLSLPLTPDHQKTKEFMLHLRLSEQSLFAGEQLAQPTPELFTPIARWLLGNPHDLEIDRLLQENPAGNRTADDLVRYWSQRLFGTLLPKPIHTQFCTIISPDTLATQPLPRGVDSWHGRQTLLRLRHVLLKMIELPQFYQS